MLISSPTSDWAEAQDADESAARDREDRLCCALFAGVVLAGSAWFWFSQLTWAMRMARAAIGAG